MDSIPKPTRSYHPALVTAAKLAIRSHMVDDIQDVLSAWKDALHTSATLYPDRLSQYRDGPSLVFFDRVATLCGMPSTQLRFGAYVACWEVGGMPVRP